MATMEAKPMHIIACIKSVVLNPPVGATVRTAVNSALNPFDRPAIETALRMKEATGGTVTVLSMGPPSARAALLESLALGADRGVLLCDPAMAGADTLATSRVLAAGIRHETPWDLLLFGTRTADSDTGHVGPQTAVRLRIPLVTGVRQVERTGEGLAVERRVDGFSERYAMNLPGALTIDPSAVRPRDPGLSGLQSAFEEDAVEVLDLAALGLDPGTVGQAGSPTRVLAMRKHRRQRTCRMLEGTARQQADALLRVLDAKGMIG